MLDATDALTLPLPAFSPRGASTSFRGIDYVSTRDAACRLLAAAVDAYDEGRALDAIRHIELARPVVAKLAAIEGIGLLGVAV